MIYIHKTKHTDNYTVIGNAHLANANLSGDARTALSYLLSRPPSWKMQVKDLQNVLNRCRTTIYKILKQLRVHGFAVLRRSYRKSEWFFSEISMLPSIPKSSIPPVESQSAGIYTGKNFHYLGSKESFLVNKENIPQPPVVVFELKILQLPKQLRAKHHKQAHKALNTLDVQHKPPSY